MVVKGEDGDGEMKINEVKVDGGRRIERSNVDIRETIGEKRTLRLIYDPDADLLITASHQKLLMESVPFSDTLVDSVSSFHTESYSGFTDSSFHFTFK